MPPCKYRFTQLCARLEGYGQIGTVPTRHNNPMDLRHSPHSSHAGESPDGIGEIPTAALGWADADRQAELWAGRGLTLGQAIETLAPPNENNTTNYLDFVSRGLDMSPDTPMLTVLRVPAI